MPPAKPLTCSCQCSGILNLLLVAATLLASKYHSEHLVLSQVDLVQQQPELSTDRGGRSCIYPLSYAGLCGFTTHRSLHRPNERRFPSHSDARAASAPGNAAVEKAERPMMTNNSACAHHCHVCFHVTGALKLRCYTAACAYSVQGFAGQTEAAPRPSLTGACRC